MSAFDPHNPRLIPVLVKSPIVALCFTLGSTVLLEVAARHIPSDGRGAVVIDMQHGLFDRLGLEAAVAAAGAPVLVRTRDAAPRSGAAASPVFPFRRWSSRAPRRAWRRRRRSTGRRVP